MKETVLAKRYAKALFQIGQERKILDILRQEVANFDSNIETHASFRAFLFSQDITRNEKKQKIEALFQDKLSNVFFNFLLVILGKNRITLFPAIANEFTRLISQLEKKIAATATTAMPLDSGSQKRLKDVLDKAFDADVQIQSDVDPTILGGIVVNIQGHVFDGSLESQLQRLRKQLLNGKN